MNHSDWLVTDNQSGVNWIFTLQDVKISPANCREGNPDYGLSMSGAWHGNRLDLDLIGATKHEGAHGCTRWFAVCEDSVRSLRHRSYLLTTPFYRWHLAAQYDWNYGVE